MDVRQIFRIVVLLNDLQFLRLLLLYQGHISRHLRRRDRVGFDTLRVHSKLFAIVGLRLIPIPVSVAIRRSHCGLCCRSLGELLTGHIYPTLIPLALIGLNYYIFSSLVLLGLV